MNNSNAINTIVFSVCIFTIGFAIFSLVFYFGEWNRFILVSLMGLFCGLVAAPEIEPKHFNNPKWFQAISGTIVGTICGYLLSQSNIGVLAGLILGGVLGLTANYWVKHVQIP